MLPKCPTTGKSSFRSERNAVRFGLEFCPRRSGTVRPYRAYRCPHCGYWHNTKLVFRANELTRFQRLKHRKGRTHDESE